MFPKTDGEAGKLLAVGPLSRRAEDLMPVLRDHRRRPTAGTTGYREVELGDPGAVEFDGLDVVISEHASCCRVRRELREARERAAGALAAAGANVRRESMKSLRRALELFLMVAAGRGRGDDAARSSTAEGADAGRLAVGDSGAAARTRRRRLLLFRRVASAPDARRAHAPLRSPPRSRCAARSRA